MPDRSGHLAFRSGSSTRIEPELGLPIASRDSSPSRSGKSRGRRRNRLWPALVLSAICGLIVLALLRDRREVSVDDPRSPASTGSVLVSYSYFEKDDVQRANAEFFLKAGMGIESALAAPKDTDFVMVVQGRTCRPCERLRSFLTADPLLQDFSSILVNAWSSETMALLWRLENEGMDFAAHNVSVDWMKQKNRLSRYKYFVFLNSSVRGPFYPNYLPAGWQWTRAFTDRLVGDVKAVSSSLVCLPDVDAGGRGPKLESWAFALDAQGLEVTTRAGVFRLRTCKLCTDDEGIVVAGEYGLSKALLGAGHNIATLLSRYQKDVDWRDARNWACNDNAHPSRHGTYDRVSMHPYETVFVKASWHVGEPHLERYTRWTEAHAAGGAGTEGTFNEGMYRYAISEAAQLPNHAAACFDVSAQARQLGSEKSER